MLGLVQAPDLEAALAAANNVFGITPADRRRIILQQVSYV